MRFILTVSIDFLFTKVRMKNVHTSYSSFHCVRGGNRRKILISGRSFTINAVDTTQSMHESLKNEEFPSDTSLQ